MLEQGPRVLVVYALIGVIKSNVARRIIYPITGAAARARRQQTYGQRGQ